jgi:hypothetical protein
MVEIMARDGYYMAYAATADIDDFDNGQAAIIVSELNAMDYFHSASIQHTKPKTININPMTAAVYPKRVTVARTLGSLSTTHYLQTGILTWMVMGVSSTAGAGDPYTHTISVDTNTSPPFMGFHYEKEGTNAARRKDILGVVPQSLDISVSEATWIAMQTFNAQFAFTGAGGNLAQPTALVQATYPPLTWSNYKHGSGASAFTYNSGAIDVDIVSIDMHLGWAGSLFGTYDSNGYPNDGHYIPPFDGYVTLGVRIQDAANTALDTISDLDHASYAGDLNFICDFYNTANKYIKYTWTDMYIDPDSYQEVFQAEGEWFDGVTFNLRFRNETSSLAVEEKNPLDKSFYGNA